MVSKTLKYNELTWLNIEDFDKEASDFLRKEFKFHALDIKDCLGTSQRSKIDIYDNYLFLILHFPSLNKERNMILNNEVEIFLTRTHLITIQKGKKKFINKSFYRASGSLKVKERFFGQDSGRLFYYVLDNFYHATLPIIDHFTKDIAILEEKIYDSQTKRVVGELALIRRNNLNARAILNPQRLVVNTLSHIQKEWFNKETQLSAYFDDILDYLEKNWAVLENQKELVSGLYESYESLISRKTNVVINILTLFSVALLPLTLLSGIYGMNIDLPWQDSPTIIWAIFAFLIAGMLGIMGYLFKKELI